MSSGSFESKPYGSSHSIPSPPRSDAHGMMEEDDFESFAGYMDAVSGSQQVGKQFGTQEVIAQAPMHTALDTLQASRYFRSSVAHGDVNGTINIAPQLTSVFTMGRAQRDELTRLRAQRREQEIARARSHLAADSQPVEDPNDPFVLLEGIKLYWPIFTVTISVFDILMLAYEIVINHGFEPFLCNPFFGPSAETLLALGAKDAQLIRKWQLWRFITPIFLHTGIIHLLFNLSFQWRSGRQLERVVGTQRLFFIYIVAGFGGNLISAIFLPNQLSVGASSSLYGLLGVVLFDLLDKWSLLRYPWIALIFTVISIMFSLSLGLLPFIDNFAHVGGFVTGLAMSIVLLPHLTKARTITSRFRRGLAVRIAWIFLILYFLGGLAIFFLNFRSDFCPFCSFINCIPIGDLCTFGEVNDEGQTVENPYCNT